MKIWQKTITAVAMLALLINSLAAPVSVLAQTIPEPTPTPEATPSISTPSGSPSQIVEPTPTPTSAPVISNESLKPSASISTNKSDYFPTDTVLITSTGFTAGKIYSIKITSSNIPPVNFTDSLTANDKNEIFYSYTLDGKFRPNYEVEIKDSETTLASTTFTDIALTEDATPPTITDISVVNPANWGDLYNIYNIANHKSIVSGLPTVGGTIKVGANFADDQTLTNVIAYLPGRGFFADSEFDPVPVNNGTWLPVPQGKYTVSWNTLSGADWRSVPDGNYDFTFQARDKGNGQNMVQNYAYKTVSLTIDNTAPDLSFASPTPGEGSILKGTVTVAANFSDVNGLMNTMIGVHGIKWFCGTNWPDNGPLSCTIDTTQVPDGPQKLTIATKDKAGNVSQIFRTVVIDNEAPNVPVPTYPVDLTINNNAPLMQWNDSVDIGSGVAGYDYQVYYNCSSSTVPGSCASVYDTSTIASELQAGATPDGTYYWHVRAKDNAGNYSNWSDFERVTIDTQAPTDPTLVSPDDNSYLATHNVTFKWNSSSDTTPIKYEWESSYSNDVKSDGSFVSRASYHKTSSTSYTKHLSDEIYYWHVRAVDAAGNKSGWSAVWKVTIDTTAPSKPAFISPGNNTFTNINAITLNWKGGDDSGSGVKGYFFRYVFYPAGGGTPISWSSSLVNTTEKTRSGTFGHGEGRYKMYIKVVDNVGNESIESNPLNVTFDTTAPTVKLLFPIPGPGATSFRAVFNESVKVTEAKNPANYFLNNWPGFGGSGNLSGHASISYNSGSHTAIITFTTPGWYISPEQNWGIQNIHDLAGNLQTPNPDSEYSTPLVAPVTTDSGPDENWHNAPVTVIFSCTDTGGSGCKNTYYTTDGSTPTTSSSTGNSVTLSSNGIYVIKYFSTDYAGNVESVKTASNAVKIDIVAPTGTWINPLDTSTVSGTVNLNFVATDSDSGVQSVIYQYKRNDGADTLHSTGSSWDTTGLPLDNYILRAVVTDNAGNTANFDETVGVAAVVSAEHGVGDGYTSATVTWTTDRPTTSRVIYDTVSHAVLGAGDNYGYAFSTTENTNKVTSHSVTITGLSAGTTYYYRTVSHGSPIAIGENNTFKTLSIAGPPAPNSASVLGLATTVITTPVFNKIAYTGNLEDKGKVLGAEATPTSQPFPSSSATSSEQANTSFNLISWIFGHKKISLGIALILVVTGYFLFRKKK